MLSNKKKSSPQPWPGAQESLEAEIRLVFPYKIHFCDNLFSVSNPLLKAVLNPNSRPVAVFFDAGLCSVQRTLQQRVQRYFKKHFPDVPLFLHVLPGGEAVKNDPAYLQAAYSAIFADRLCKQSSIIAIGGGAFLDLTGFAATTAHRGIAYWRVPTTTLSQADSGIGIKSAVNFQHHKNGVGAHDVPRGILVDATLLRTLPVRDWISGLGECLKIALINSREYFDELERGLPAYLARQYAPSTAILRTCARAHFEHIRGSSDPYEKSQSRPLDFGHWAAHRIEALSKFAVLHGEAVLLGIALDSLYAHRLGRLPENSLARVLSFVSACGIGKLARQQRDALNPEALLKGLDEFRRHIGGPLCITLLEDIARPFETNVIDINLMEQCIRELPARI